MESISAIHPVEEVESSYTEHDYFGLLSFPTLPIDNLHYTLLFDQLLKNIAWQQDSFTAFDRRFSIPRLQAWFADDGLRYRYADNLLTSQPWIDPLLQLRQIIQNTTGHKFNSVLATRYRSGNDYVTWHSDDEKELGPNPVIASLSLGSARYFEYRHKTQNTKGGLLLGQGDFLIMEPEFQKHWEHQVPMEPHVSGCRINLTFRYVEKSAR